MLANFEEIRNLIPQKEPMIMVDGLIEHNNLQTISRLIVTKNNLFCKDGFFHEPGLIENMAQTAALRSGYEAQLKNETPKIGFIGSLKNITIHHLPKDSDELNTKITVLNELFQALIIRCEVFVSKNLIAEGEMTIFLKE
jgi:3-hydroxymyristoyl/3-hydroxydecanoyl-(acyl carrier protein) dehydratase